MILHSKFSYKLFHVCQYFEWILLLMHQLSCVYIYNFYCLSILLSHDLSHSKLQLLEFQINSLSYLPLSINSSLHSHLHLSSFHLCLLLQTLTSNLHLHLQVSYHFMCLVGKLHEIKLNILTFTFLTISGTHNLAHGSLVLLQLPLHLFTLILKG